MTGDGGQAPVVPSIAADDPALEFRSKRSSGPGGQHVNRTESAIELRFTVHACAALPEPVRLRLRAQCAGRLSRDDVLVIHADRFRSQAANREDALERLRELVRIAATPPQPRRATRPSRGERERRLQDKKARSQRKQLRGRPSGNGDGG